MSATGNDIVAIAVIFALAGFVKGVVGLGLPTISMGLLALTMPSPTAASLLLVPSFVTNLWQMFRGPGLRPLLRRLWGMMAAVCLGTWAGAGSMSPQYAPYSTGLLGLIVLLYGLSGLLSFRFDVPQNQRKWVSPVIGGITGLITSATGVFIIPAAPYLQGIGLEKEELVQALGLSFTVSTLALAVNLVHLGAVDKSLAWPSAIALVTTLAGMAAGQAIRLRIDAKLFRTLFFGGLVLLGMHLAFRAIV